MLLIIFVKSNTSRKTSVIKNYTKDQEI